MDVCRDPSTAQTWTVHEEICQPGRVMQAVAEDRTNARGLFIYAKRG